MAYLECWQLKKLFSLYLKMVNNFLELANTEEFRGQLATRKKS